MRSWFKTPFSPLRRFSLAVCALAMAALCLRIPISEALVVRGDSNLYRSDLSAALRHYRLALFFDGNSITAADRLLFVSAMRHGKKGIVSAIRDTEAIVRRSNDAALLSDRALCLLVLRRYEAAYGDFAAAARLNHSSITLTFAAYAARRVNRASDAARLWRLAALAQREGR